MRSFWHGRRVLLTGHTGFKGAWLALWLHRLGAQVTGFALPPEPDALWPHLHLDGEVNSLIGDIRDPEAVANAYAVAEPEIVLHLAAQALVRRGYADPRETFDTNVMGTLTVLDTARRQPSIRAVLVITSDKVYENRELGRFFVEGDPLGGHDPYSASKACTEIVTASLDASFLRAAGISVARARAGNVIGGGDLGRDRLIPDLIRAVNAEQPLLIRNPDSVRPWQHVLDPLHGYLRYAQALVERGADALPPALNFGPLDREIWTVRRVIDTVIAEIGQGRWEQDGHPGVAEAKLLSLDPTLAVKTLDWRPLLSVEDGLRWTASWWRAIKDQAPRALCERQIDDFQGMLTP